MQKHSSVERLWIVQKDDATVNFDLHSLFAHGARIQLCHQRRFNPFKLDFDTLTAHTFTKSIANALEHSPTTTKIGTKIKRNEKKHCLIAKYGLSRNYNMFEIFFLLFFFADAAIAMADYYLYSLWHCIEYIGSCLFVRLLLFFAFSRRRMLYDYWHNMLGLLASVICFHVHGMRLLWRLLWWQACGHLPFCLAHSVCCFFLFSFVSVFIYIPF